METMIDEKLSIDKTNWTPVKFGDVVFEPKESSKNPHADGIEHVVGLEHIEPENIHLKNSATLEESTTFTKRFAIGDVLFGRRRAYLKKAAQASFSGICSGDITVFRANEKLMSELLPFIVNNEKFFDYAVKHSAGGLSPRVKFKDLANYEFLLPPKDQQAQLAKLLWAIDDVIEKERTVLSKIERIKQIEYLNAFMNGKKVNRADDIVLPNNSWKLVSIKEVVPDIEYGISISIPSNQNPKGIPIISTAEIDREGNLDYSIVRSINYAKMNDRVTLHSGDVLFNWRNSAELIGKSAIFNQPENDQRDYTFASFILRMRCDEESMHNKYLMHLFNFYRISEIFLGLARRAVNQANFNKNEVYDLKIPVPPYNIQLEIMERIDQVEASKKTCLDKISSSQSLQKSLINQVF
ncbi:restriction endonuclease subunit S [Pontibacter sp. G13]|uniref:restriction endonuclease subunit S n=1 Tax=Pontibacter sp. G13 TaxID=3074898 RepID=UPI00288C0288|nr:restriction endonuclease subunit S [Pontibacter sp. G13]WNJ19921.1 restriction endonuclease subunit S [Pontibacter sp. G13]